MNREFQIYRWSDTATEEEAVSGLAEALGMNYDHELHVMYMGDDKDNGFCVAGINGVVTKNMEVKGWCNGAATNNGYCWSTISSGDNQRSIAYIINDDETAGAFGPSISEMRSTFSKATHADGSEGYIFSITSPSNYNTFDGVFGENLKVRPFKEVLIVNNSLLGLIPMALPNENTLVSDETYIKVIGSNTDGMMTKFVSSNGEDYLFCVSVYGGAGYSQPVLHLGKS